MVKNEYVNQSVEVVNLLNQTGTQKQVFAPNDLAEVCTVNSDYGDSAAPYIILLRYFLTVFPNPWLCSGFHIST